LLNLNSSKNSSRHPPFALPKLLTVFNNKLDDKAIALAARISSKIEKWGAHHARVQKAMEALLTVAAKKKQGVMLNTQTAAGFVSSSGKFPSSLAPGSRFSVLIPDFP
jgi:hypothetical protein